MKLQPLKSIKTWLKARHEQQKLEYTKKLLKKNELEVAKRPKLEEKRCNTCGKIIDTDVPIKEEIEERYFFERARRNAAFELYSILHLEEKKKLFNEFKQKKPILERIIKKGLNENSVSFKVWLAKKLNNQLPERFQDLWNYKDFKQNAPS